jgi:hypothetical protein
MKMTSLVKNSGVLCGLLFALSASAQPVKDAPPVADSEKPAADKPAADKPAATPADKPAAAKPNAAAAGNSNILVERTGSGQKLFRITEGLVVEGQRQKPNAFYVLQRASAPYDWEALEESFLPRILKAAEKPPF